jgi:hypothetical protein
MAKAHIAFASLPLARFEKSSSWKQLGQMNRNLVRSIYGMSFMKIDHFVPIG